MSQYSSKEVEHIVKNAIAKEQGLCSEILRQATVLMRFIIKNRGCACNRPDHRCGTNQMLADVAKIEEHIS